MRKKTHIRVSKDLGMELFIDFGIVSRDIPKYLPTFFFHSSSIVPSNFGSQISAPILIVENQMPWRRRSCPSFISVPPPEPERARGTMTMSSMSEKLGLISQEIILSLMDSPVVDSFPLVVDCFLVVDCSFVVECSFVV